MKKLKSSNNSGGSYKQIKEQLDLAMTMFEEGVYTIDEYETLIIELKNDFLRLDCEKRSGFKS